MAGGGRQEGRALLDALRRLAAGAEELQGEPERIARAVRQTYWKLQEEIAIAQMAAIPVSRLRETTKGLRIDALERHGFRTLDQLLSAHPAQLMRIPNVGESTATKAIAAAEQIESAARQAAKVRIDMEKQPPAHTTLLDGLRRYANAEQALASVTEGLDWLDPLVPLIDQAEPAVRSKVRLCFTGRATKHAAVAALEHLTAQAAAPLLSLLRSGIDAARAERSRGRSDDEVWDDYKRNAAELLGVLEEITGVGDAASSHGHLPTEIVERVRQQQLDLTFMTASLRGYQAFGAKFALVQRRTILGDEMGLGKTVEALAALAHLRARGKQHALVVCPASVVANWRNEIRRHTRLEVHVIHGTDRNHAQSQWSVRGGIAITTFDGLKRLPKPNGLDPIDNGRTVLPMLVVDEAHYAKNPRAGRTQAVAEWANASQRVLFLSGTPMENRVQEFRNLVHMLQPTVAQSLPTELGIAGAEVFRQAVAPAYLRRNQIDVLDELPERLDSLDWVDPTAADFATYRQAVGAGGFMAMRRAAFTSVGPHGDVLTREQIEQSAKVSRLVDIIEEAAEEDLKVIVFSFFRDVLEIVTSAARAALPGAVYGPLTGSVTPDRRQEMVDLLAAHHGPAVLTGQIEAGGTGLNIQSASVVVLCEPQWKPSVESQAIARAHRMGQVRRVQVHRLLTPESVDQRMLAVLAGKQEAFDAFVSRSDIKDLTPEAIDVSDLEAVSRVASEAEAERQIIDAEQRRLGFVQDQMGTAVPADGGG